MGTPYRLSQTQGIDPITGVPSGMPGMGMKTAYDLNEQIPLPPNPAGAANVSGGGTMTIPPTSISTSPMRLGMQTATPTPPPEVPLPPAFGAPGAVGAAPKFPTLPRGRELPALGLGEGTAVSTAAKPGMPPTQTTTPPPGGTGEAPHGGDLTDPGYVADLVHYWGSQPGADPSLLNDPGYWTHKILSGEFGADENYIINKMQTAWTGGGGNGGGEFSPDSGGSIPGLIGGHTAFGGDIEAILRRIIEQGGVTPNISGDLINAREGEAAAEQAQLEDAKAQLADMGGLSEPGVTQGPSVGAVERIQSNIAPAYAQKVRDIYTHASDTQNANLISALQMATGMSEAEANAVIGSVGVGTQRQVALAGIALDQLKQSDAWNQFLAQYGLDQAKLELDINNGNWQHVIDLLTIYTQGGQVAAGGHF